MTTKTPTEEIQYLGQMLSATTIEDASRLEAIIKRLKAISENDSVLRIELDHGSSPSEEFVQWISSTMDEAAHKIGFSRVFVNTKDETTKWGYYQSGIAQ